MYRLWSMDKKNSQLTSDTFKTEEKIFYKIKKKVADNLHILYLEMFNNNFPVYRK